MIGLALYIVEGKFTVFALFYFVFEDNFPNIRPRGAYTWRGDFNGGFFALPVWGAYTWRALFSEFYGIFNERYIDIVIRVIGSLDKSFTGYCAIF